MYAYEMIISDSGRQKCLPLIPCFRLSSALWKLVRRYLHLRRSVRTFLAKLWELLPRKKPLTAECYFFMDRSDSGWGILHSTYDVRCDIYFFLRAWNISRVLRVALGHQRYLTVSSAANVLLVNLYNCNTYHNYLYATRPLMMTIQMHIWK